MTEISLKKIGQIFIASDTLAASAIAGLKNGAYRVKLTKDRSTPHHRKFFALLHFAFAHWEVEEGFKDFESFRENITILAGHYKQVWDVNGNLVLRAKSISFAKMDQVEFDALYSRVIDIILKHVLTRYTREDLESVALEVIRYAV